MTDKEQPFFFFRTDTERNTTEKQSCQEKMTGRPFATEKKNGKRGARSVYKITEGEELKKSVIERHC